MDARGLHYIEDDLGESFLQELAAATVAEAEVYLAKHAAFLDAMGENE